MNAKLLEAAVEYHGKELFNMILKQNNVEDAMMKSDETNEREEVDSVEWYFRFLVFSLTLYFPSHFAPEEKLIMVYISRHKTFLIILE